MSNNTGSNSVQILVAIIGAAAVIIAGFAGSVAITINNEQQDEDSPITEMGDQVPPAPAVSTGTCNFEDGWILQDNGITYRWVGATPGSPGCPFVGLPQSIIQDLRNTSTGYEFVIEVGSEPLPLAICVGEFAADRIIDGRTCVGVSQEDQMPQVAGTLRVSNTLGASAGFKVGYER